MEYRVLGKLEAERDGIAIDLGTHRQRSLLGLLLTQPNTVWSTDRIIDSLWGDDVGSDRQNALWVYVSGLRKALEPDREKRTEGTILLTRAPGYLLDVAPDTIDAVRFERLVAEGRALVDSDPDAASLVLGEALSLWRGRAYEDFAYEAWAQTEIGRLDELRLEAVEARIDADLLRGMSRELVSELESLVRQHPLQERLTGQLMVALYRSGRQAESLRSYQTLRSRLGDELGIEPSTQLRRLEERIVTGDETLTIEARSRVAGPEPGLAVRGYELRERLGERGSGVVYRAFQPGVGREVAIKVIRAELANDPEFIRRFEAEAQLVARLEHPHVVPLYDYWREPDAAYLVMRLMRGGSLADLAQRGPLDRDHVVRIAEQIGGALASAHRSGVTHGDVRAANVLIDDDGNAYLADFDIAGNGDAGSDAEAFALVVAQAITGIVGDLSATSPALPVAIRPIVERAVWSADDVLGFVERLRDGLGASAADVTTLDVGNPFKGLRSFEGADAANFFGRERLIERLLARLGEPASRFVAVVGPSGSGKSSVVRAGLLPAVRSGGLTGGWFTVEMTPAPRPFEALEDALLAVAVDPPASLLEQLVDGVDGLARSVRRILPDDGSRLLLVVDQFEELFTQVDAQTTDRFIATLVDAVTDAHGRLSVVATLRADFYDRPLRHRALGELLRDGTEIITPMTPDELDRAITGPVERHGIEFERSLVSELVHDVVDRAGALPLLQYTLTELFDARTGNRIAHGAYDELGGVSGALVKRAEGLYAGLGDEARDVARQVFLRLVTLGEGTDDTRRRVLRSELEQLAVERRFLDGVLETFGRHRLLSFDRDPVTRGPTVEISHEALLGAWDRLREWIDGARHDVRSQRRLADAMTEWTNADRSDQFLLRGGRLQQLEGWAATTSLPLSEPEQAFLDASIAERARVETEEHEREERASEAERKERQRAHQLVGAVAIGVVIALLAGFGLWQWRTAVDANAAIEELVTVNALTLSSSVVLADDPELATLLAVQAVKESADLGYATEGSVDALHWALQELGADYGASADTAVAIRSGPDGPAGVYALSPAELVDIAGRHVFRNLSRGECEPFYGGTCPPLAAVAADLPIRGGSEAYGAQAPGPSALDGGTIRISSMFLIPEPGFEVELEAFTEETGIDVEWTRYNGDDLPRILSGVVEVPDVLVFPGPIPDWAQERAIGLGNWLDHETLRADYGDYLLNSAVIERFDQRLTRNNVARALPIDLDLGGMVYYPKRAFDAAGYTVPTTWDELMALSHRMVADGRTPWCMGFAHGGSGPFDGWPAAHWIESLVLRVTGGLEAYGDWSRGEIGFTSPEVMEAGRLLDDLIHEPGFTDPEPSEIGITDWDGQLFTMVAPDPATGEQPPTCWLHHQRDLMIPIYAGLARMGDELDYFLLPPIDPSGPSPTIGAAQVAAALVDRPEVRLLFEHLADPQFGSTWAGWRGRPGEPEPPTNNLLPPNRRFDLADLGPDDDPEVEMKRRMLGDLRAALEANALRGPATDVMPEAIGGLDGARPNAFYAGIMDWITDERSIEQVFEDIDSQWRALGGLGRVTGF